MNTQEYIDFMRELATISGSVIKPYFFNSNLEVESKSDDSPVTIADKKAEERMRDLIEKTYPAHGIIGEEHGSIRKEAEFVWTAPYHLRLACRCLVPLWLCCITGSPSPE